LVTLTVVVHIPSPYHIEFFDALRTEGNVELIVVYVKRRSRDRQWEVPEPSHEHLFLEDGTRVQAAIERAVGSSDLVVFGFYGTRGLKRLISLRARSGRPWCLWGERPGFRFPGPAGRSYRIWRLDALHRSKAPIWGIGKFALEGYRREFGVDRDYYNVPYFSDLDRFSISAADCQATPGAREFLFSGSLIKRKGVSTLASAFLKICAHDSDSVLGFVGDGVLRPGIQRKLRAVEGQTRFYGFQPWSKLPDIYRDASFLCVPSRYDGWGLVVAEGLAAGLPVIATDRTGAALDLIEHGVNGWILPAGDEQALYAAMMSAANLPNDELNVMRNAAKRSVSRHTLYDGVRVFERAAADTVTRWHR
jgi:glycosyltransferase involved in cell wall biosynthesis